MCPECNYEDLFNIEAKIMVPTNANGYDTAQAEPEWNDQSRIDCTNCGHSGTVAEFKKGPRERFTLNVGTRQPQPDNGDTWIYDNQEKKPAVTIHGEYGQVVCLETVGASGPSALCDWLNGLSNRALISEGIPPTKATENRPAEPGKAEPPPNTFNIPDDIWDAAMKFWPTLEGTSTGGNVDYIIRPLKRGCATLSSDQDAGSPTSINDSCCVSVWFDDNWDHGMTFNFKSVLEALEFMVLKLQPVNLQ